MAYSDVILADSPFSYWHLNDTSGTTAVDSVGTSPGTYTGAVTLNQQGLLTIDPDTAIVNGGGNGTTLAYVDFGSPGTTFDFAGNAPYSFEVWFLPVDVTNLASRRIFNKLGTDVNGTQGYGMSIQPNGVVLYTRNVNGVATSCNTGAGIVAVGNSYHVVGTYDGANLNLYVNGRRVAGPVATAAVVVANTGSFRLGSSSTAGSYFDGTFDEFAVYNYALTAAQAQVHFLAGAPDIFVPSRMPLGV